MITLAKLIIAYLLPWIFGIQVLVLLDRQNVLSRDFKIFAGFLVGVGVFTLEAFVFGILGGKLILLTLLAIILGDIVVLELVRRFFIRSTSPFPSPSPGEGKKAERSKWLIYLILILLAIKVIASVWQVTHIPTYEFDAWNNWNLRAKVIYVEQGIPLDKNDPFYLGGGIKSYPLNDGLWKVWVANMIGSWNENLTGLVSVVYYVVLLGLFYFSLPQSLSRNLKMIATYLLGSLPFLYFHSWIPYADLAFATYLFLALSTFFQYVLSHQKIYLVISAIALAFTIWTKNEGFAVVLPALFVVTTVLVITKTVSIRNFLKLWLVTPIVVSPWLIFRFVNKLELLSGDSSTFKLIFNSQFLNEAWHSIFLRSHFNFLWLLVFLLIIFKAKKIWQEVPLRFLTLTLIGSFMFYNGIITFTDKAFDLSALARVNLQIVPLAMYLVVLLIQKRFST